MYVRELCAPAERWATKRWIQTCGSNGPARRNEIKILFITKRHLGMELHPVPRVIRIPPCISHVVCPRPSACSRATGGESESWGSEPHQPSAFDRSFISPFSDWAISCRADGAARARVRLIGEASLPGEADRSAASGRSAVPLSPLSFLPSIGPLSASYLKPGEGSLQTATVWKAQGALGVSREIRGMLLRCTHIWDFFFCSLEEVA